MRFEGFALVTNVGKVKIQDYLTRAQMRLWNGPYVYVCYDCQTFGIRNESCFKAFKRSLKHTVLKMLINVRIIYF